MTLDDFFAKFVLDARWRKGFSHFGRESTSGNNEFLAELSGNHPSFLRLLNRVSGAELPDKLLANFCDHFAYRAGQSSDQILVHSCRIYTLYICTFA